MAKSGKRGISRSLPDVVRHIIDATTQVTRLVDGYDAVAFEQDEKTQFAVVRCLEIIAEASRDIPDAIKQGHVEVLWRRMEDAGDMYQFKYDDVRPDVVWRVVRDDLPILKSAIESIRERHCKP